MFLYIKRKQRRCHYSMPTSEKIEFKQRGEYAVLLYNVNNHSTRLQLYALYCYNVQCANKLSQPQTPSSQGNDGCYLGFPSCCFLELIEFYLCTLFMTTYTCRLFVIIKVFYCTMRLIDVIILLCLFNVFTQHIIVR